MVTPPQPSADVAVCTLRTRTLPASLSGHARVAAAAPLATANLGIEEVVRGTLARFGIAHLVVCGQDSRLFRPGQSLLALAAHGTTPDGTIIGAEGYRARLPNLRPTVIAAFRRRIAVHDLRGQDDPVALLAAIDALPRQASASSAAAGTGDDSDSRGASEADGTDDSLRKELAASEPPLVRLPAVGRIRRATPAGAGCFVISLDRPAGKIVLRHYGDDLTRGHELCHHSATALTLAVIDLGFTADPGHAGYLGGELAKAETALRLGLEYIQDRPLSARPGESEVPRPCPPASRMFPMDERYDRHSCNGVFL